MADRPGDPVSKGDAATPDNVRAILQTHTAEKEKNS